MDSSETSLRPNESMIGICVSFVILGSLLFKLTDDLRLLRGDFNEVIRSLQHLAEAHRILQKKLETCENEIVGNQRRLTDLVPQVETLQAAEKDREASWQDDVTEPGKFQAIVGTGTVNGVSWEFRFIRTRLETFKSNRYWFLNSDAVQRRTVIYFLNSCDLGGNFQKNNENKYLASKMLESTADLDSMIQLECVTEKLDENQRYNSLNEAIEAAKGPDFKWRRKLVDSF